MPIRESLDSAKAHVPSQNSQPAGAASGRSDKTNAAVPGVGPMSPLEERPHRVCYSVLLASGLTVSFASLVHEQCSFLYAVEAHVVLLPNIWI